MRYEKEAGMIREELTGEPGLLEHVQRVVDEGLVPDGEKTLGSGGCQFQHPVAPATGQKNGLEFHGRDEMSGVVFTWKRRVNLAPSEELGENRNSK